MHKAMIKYMKSGWFISSNNCVNSVVWFDILFFSYVRDDSKDMTFFSFKECNNELMEFSVKCKFLIYVLFILLNYLKY